MKEEGTCPICAMDLVPVRKRSGLALPAPSTEADLQGASDDSVFTVDPRRQQLINVQTTAVERRKLGKVIRTVANLELDETQIRHVNPKTKGWIEKVFVDFTLQRVKRGDPLFSIYSPELVATQEEYLLALRPADNLGQSAFDFVSNGARSLLDATRRRLQLFDITDEQIHELKKTSQVRKTLVIYSPVSGHRPKKSFSGYPSSTITLWVVDVTASCL